MRNKWCYRAITYEKEKHFAITSEPSELPDNTNRQPQIEADTSGAHMEARPKTFIQTHCRLSEKVGTDRIHVTSPNKHARRETSTVDDERPDNQLNPLMAVITHIKQMA